jgi:glucose-6-phosphate isomerase
MRHAAAFDDRIFRNNALGFTLDLSGAPAAPAPGIEDALAALADLEAGAVANADEGRQVGHYWLRDPERAPTAAVQAEIIESWGQVADLPVGQFREILLIGIGGSALGPQLLAEALRGAGDAARLHFLDNTDPEGILRVLSALSPAETLCLVASKSGGTVETRNGMIAAMRWVEAAGLPWAPRAVAITTPGSALDRKAAAEGWLARLPLWDWVGGRTSVTGTVGLAPMALAGWDWRGLLRGAAEMDAWCRGPAEQNPAAQLAMAWFAAGGGRGARALVIEPYRDRLALVGRYLQQLVMESLGKRLDRRGARVEQGLTVYGNKGSTDQHAFMQQVRDGRDDTFVHFIDTAAPAPRLPVGDGLFADDHLLGFQLGTRAALTEAGRPTVTITLAKVDAPSLGALISIFERAVGLYAELIDVNAYHQPGVEAGKLGASRALSALGRLAGALTEVPTTAAELAEGLDVEPAVAWRLLEHLAATGRATRAPGDRPLLDAYRRP